MGAAAVRESVTLAGRAERARAARAFVSEVLGHGHPCGEDAALLVSEIAWSFTPGCLLNARPALTPSAATVPPTTRERAPGGPGRNSPHLQKSGF
jgi:hypothetical protein